MRGSEARGEGTRTVVYCLVPFSLAAKLHEPLRAHFTGDPDVEVVVERRARDRRAAPERRAVSEAPDGERRRIRNEGGRRVGPRRAPTLPVEAPLLPRKARPYADELAFVERLEPSEEHLADLDSARLVTRFQAGDEDAFTALYMRYFDRVYAYVRVLFRGDSHEAEDVTQQVFVGAFEGLPRYERRRQPFRAWLFTIARNQAVSRLSKRSRSEPVEPRLLAERYEDVSGEEEPRAEIGWLADRELVMFVERLPLAQRQVLVLRYMLDLPTKEIAAMLGRSAEDVRALESRALRFLQARLTAIGRRTTQRRGQLPSHSRVHWMHVLRHRRLALRDGAARIPAR
jgi:RNA polymerase sigma-70 factor (ECF subfamily)